ncbi:helix-turn-helix domain-containing protein [Desulfarculus baarsii]
MKTSTHLKPASQPQDWHKADIKAALEKAGWSLRRLAARHGYTGAALVKALRQPYPNAERIIAGALGLRPEDIWPRRYADRPLPLSPDVKNTGKIRHSPHSKDITTPKGLSNQKDKEGV